MSQNSQNPSVNARYQALFEAHSRTPRKFDPPRDDSGRRLKISEFFGQNTFDLPKMKEKLPKDVYVKLLSTIQTGKKLDPDVAANVALAVKEWALLKGVTHYTHWFQPQTGLTAEKHDAFINPEDESRVIEKFSGSQLVQSEPDASSFPSGGMRTTFEARGYAAWDPSSPIFIMEGPSTKTLCIPSVFISYHGQALDEKTSLLRSIEALSSSAVSLLHTIGENKVKRVIPTLGIEQEYFLIDRSYFMLRPDLISSGRTLVGGQPPKGQQLEDHYFGAIPSRVQAFMSEMEYELYKLGVPVKTRHNEVAPCQFECAPVFEEANVATDHNQIVMEVMKKVSQRHGFQVLFHEKPFAGINGSGKHNNWSLSISASDVSINGDNLLEPGKTPHENIRFLLILASILKGVSKHAGLLRASIASSGNDHRLGANEAPPAIISVFLGSQLSKILDTLESGQGIEKKAEQLMIELGVSSLPAVMKDNTDRNRTSPFAFTGNKFEFRAVGSSANTAFPVTMLNSAVADGINEVNSLLKQKGVTAATTDSLKIFEVIKEIVKQTKSIRFEGNGYSEEWVTEAKKRGLPNLRKSPEAIRELISDSSKKLLAELNVLSEEELNSRYNIRLERHIKNLQIEADCLKAMIETQIQPACFQYLSSLALGQQALESLKVSNASMRSTMAQVSIKLDLMMAELAKLKALCTKAEGLHDEFAKASLYSEEVAPQMLKLRSLSDELESFVADDFWPLPKYREMLFSS